MAVLRYRFHLVSLSRMSEASAVSFQFFPVCAEALKYSSFVISPFVNMSLNIGSSALLNTHLPSFCTISPYSTALTEPAPPTMRKMLRKAHHQFLLAFALSLICNLGS